MTQAMVKPKRAYRYKRPDYPNPCKYDYPYADDALRIPRIPFDEMMESSLAICAEVDRRRGLPAEQ